MRKITVVIQLVCIKTLYHCRASLKKKDANNEVRYTEEQGVSLYLFLGCYRDVRICHFLIPIVFQDD